MPLDGQSESETVDISIGGPSAIDSEIAAPHLPITEDDGAIVPSEVDAEAVEEEETLPLAERFARPAKVVLVVFAAALVASLLFRLANGKETDTATNLLVPTPTAVPERESDREFLDVVLAQTAPLTDGAPAAVDVTPGLALFYGGRDPMQWIDLTTGESGTIGIQVEPLAQSGDHLVLASEDHRLVGWLPLGSLSEMPQGWTASRAALSTEPGRMWFYHLDDSRWVDVELATGRVQRWRNAQGQTTTSVLPWHPMSLVSGPDLISTPDGVFEWRNNAYVQVSTGRVLTTTDEWVLIERCDPPDEPCGVAWFDRQTWDQVDRPTPTNPVQSAEVVGDGRWLLAADRDRAGFDLIELATGRRIRFDPKVQSVTVSPNGQLVAFIRSGEVHLADLDQLDSIERLAIFGASAHGRLRFVELPG